MKIIRCDNAGENDTLKENCVKNSTEISFDKKMANKAREGFILTTKFHNSANYSDLLDPEKQNLEFKAYIQPEGTAVKKQENATTTKS